MLIIARAELVPVFTFSLPFSFILYSIIFDRLCERLVIESMHN